MTLLCLLTIVNVASASVPKIDENMTNADVQLLQTTFRVETNLVQENAPTTMFIGYVSSGMGQGGGESLASMADPFEYLDRKCKDAYGIFSQAATEHDIARHRRRRGTAAGTPPRLKGLPNKPGTWGEDKGAIVKCAQLSDCVHENKWAKSVNKREFEEWPESLGEFTTCNNWCNQVICVKQDDCERCPVGTCGRVDESGNTGQDIVGPCYIWDQNENDGVHCKLGTNDECPSSYNCWNHGGSTYYTIPAKQGEIDSIPCQA